MGCIRLGLIFLIKEKAKNESIKKEQISQQTLGEKSLYSDLQSPVSFLKFDPTIGGFLCNSKSLSIIC